MEKCGNAVLLSSITAGELDVISCRLEAAHKPLLGRIDALANALTGTNELAKILIKQNMELHGRLKQLEGLESQVKLQNERMFKLSKENLLLVLENQRKDLAVQKTKLSVSFQLGNTLLTAAKSWRGLVTLPAKLVQVRNYAKFRKAGKGPVVNPAKPVDSNQQIKIPSIASAKQFDVKLRADAYVELTANPLWVGQLTEGRDMVALRIRLKEQDEFVYKSILARVMFFDVEGARLTAPQGVHHSAAVGDYMYLSADESGQLITVEIAPPKGSAIVLFGLQSWHSKKGIFLRNAFETEEDISRPEQLDDTDDEFFALKDGVSVIVPSYKGLETVPDLLRSIENQTIDKKLIQLVVVVNGEEVGVSNLVRAFSIANPDIEVQLTHSDKLGVANARNVGIELANRKFATFVDNDDFVSHNFLTELYRRRIGDGIVVCGIHDFRDGVVNADNAINRQYLKVFDKKAISYGDVTSLLTMVACKLVPTKWIKNLKFDLELNSGEDVVYFSQLIAKHKPAVASVGREDVVYMRRLSANSVSRRLQSFDFDVRQRLDVISRLIALKVTHANDVVLSQFVDSKIIAQAGFVKRYLESHEHEAESCVALIRSMRLHAFPFHLINQGKAKDLVIAYCFPPYVDTSACVMAKRIRAAGQIVDVVQNDMAKVRKLDDSLNLIASDLIAGRKIIKSPTTFANWAGIEEFAKKTVDWATREGANYRAVYSRALWPASHFAAFLLKITRPEIKWISEFSDPVLYDLESKMRESDLSPEFLKKISTACREANVFPLETSNLYYWCEFLPYIFADEIVFTCENQRSYMLDSIADENVRQNAYVKSVISPHPVLGKEFYELSDVQYELNRQKVNLGYFGAFYSKRNLNEILVAMMRLSPEERERVVLHVFTEQPDDAKAFMRDVGLAEVVRVNPYLGYLDFLRVSTVFDVLIVNDSKVSSFKGINPYLPSKVSDYVGSGSDVWALVEEGSALSRMQNIKYRSTLDDHIEVLKTLREILDLKSGSRHTDIQSRLIPEIGQNIIKAA